MSLNLGETVEVKVGIIGGTGMQDWDVFESIEVKEVDTPYGKPSGKIHIGLLHGVKCVLLNRHGSGHRCSPTVINYRANVFALYKEGCTHVLSTSACGSLKEECKPGEFVILDSFIDRTTKRRSSFYDATPGGLEGVCHIPMRHPFNAKLCDIILQSCCEGGIPAHKQGTAVTVEGPRFSSLAESNLFRSWGASVINMTTVPEVVLAGEVGLLYATVAMVTDYDCWKEDHDAVDVSQVMKVMRGNRENVTKVLCSVIKAIGGIDWKEEVIKARNVAKCSVMQ